MLLVLLTGLAVLGCAAVPVARELPQAPSTTAQLKYYLLAEFGNVYWLDPDRTSVALTDAERQQALAQFPAIRAQADDFTAILTELGLPPKNDYTDAEKLLVYREYKKLSYAVQLVATGEGYSFELRTGAGQGLRYYGTISPYGEIISLSQESSANVPPYTWLGTD